MGVPARLLLIAVLGGIDTASTDDVRRRIGVSEMASAWSLDESANLGMPAWLFPAQNDPFGPMTQV